MTIAEKLKYLRKEHNMTQEDMAEKLNVSRQTISKWETNITIPDADNIHARIKSAAKKGRGEWINEAGTNNSAPSAKINRPAMMPRL